jgi:hypothetical protein
MPTMPGIFPQCLAQFLGAVKEIQARSTPVLLVAAAVGVLASFHASYAAAGTRNPWAVEWGTAQQAPAPDGAKWNVRFGPAESLAGGETVALPSFALAENVLLQAPAAPQPETVNPRPKSFQYSHGYEVRRKIHVYASIATLPLFGVQAYLGQKLYNGGFSDAERTAHQWVGASIVGLFALNTVTGIWNLHEGWGDPSQKKLRVTHGVLMLAADAGFAYSAFAAPGRRADVSTHSTHRNVAYFSISAATAGYLIMLFGR